MSNKLSAGTAFPLILTRNIQGEPVSIPDRNGRWTHLQFRRFAGCPICNLHLQSFVRRHGEIAEAGIHEVVAFHSTDEELLPYQGQFPFDVVGDPQKELYRRCGVETSLWALLNPKAWCAAVRGNLANDRPAMNGSPKGGMLGLPADFLISPRGAIREVHYGTHSYDQWTVDDVLAKRRAAS